jgi:peptidoglycan/LPS O-acetylase OafA/YrhL
MKIRAEDETNNFTLLRLLLSLAVVLGHFKLLSGTEYPRFPFNLADAAVDCFFVVSGFLIALSYARTRGLWSFYVRRFFRLYPMYACIVLIQTGIMLSLLPGGPFSEPHATLRYLAVNLAFANFLQYDIGGVLHGLRVPGINPSLWTLKIELGFYLIVPLIFVAVRRWGFKALVLIFVASVAYNVVGLWLGDPRYAKQLPGQMQFFVVGMALYLYARDFRIPRWVFPIVAVLFLTAWTWIHPIPPGIRPLLVAAFVFCFALGTPVLPMRSDMSYSVYLLHGPLIQMLLLLGLFRDQPPYLIGVVAAVLALSFVAEHLVERPGNEFGRRLSVRLRPQRPAAVPSVA